MHMEDKSNGKQQKNYGKTIELFFVKSKGFCKEKHEYLFKSSVLYKASPSL